MPTALATRGTTRAVAAAARRPALADEGIIVGIVAVTGTKDSVEDVIVPGAFAKTLRERRAKLCWMHDWKLPLGRVLHIVEMLPGDKRLPKVLPDGKAWPKEAGALIATMQFNLRTQQGREFFEHAKAWAINGEAAFSIGYRVVDGMSSKRADGVRLIYALDLFEVSLVLHGAHPMALALEVKSASPFDLETKDTDGLMQVKAAHAAVLEAKALPKTQKCAKCSSPATKRVIHADGRAYQPTCDGHEKSVKAGLDEVVGVRPIEGKSALDAVLEAKSLPVSPEGKSMPRISGSYEERRALLVDALETLLTPKNDKGERDSYCCIDATFDDHVIATVTGFGNEQGQSWKVPYTITPVGPELGKPVEVELSVIVSGPESEPVKTSDAVRMRFIAPATTMLDEANRFVASMPEGKGASELELPLLTLLDTLAMKGYDMAAVMGDDQYGEDDDMPSEHDQYRGQRKGMDDEEAEGYDDVEPDGDEDDAYDDEDPEGDVEGEGPYSPEDYPGDEEEDAATVEDESEQIKLDPDEVYAQIKELLA